MLGIDKGHMSPPQAEASNPGHETETASGGENAPTLANPGARARNGKSVWGSKLLVDPHTATLHGGPLESLS